MAYSGDAFSCPSSLLSSADIICRGVTTSNNIIIRDRGRRGLFFDGIDVLAVGNLPRCWWLKVEITSLVA
jgi:hypothetical protein